MRPTFSFLLTALAAAAPLALSAAPATPPLLLKGTPVRVRLESDLRSGQTKVDTPVLFTVDQNVYGPNHMLLLAKGAVARGRVLASAGHGAFGRVGRLTFTCDYALTDDGTRVPLHLLASPVSPAGSGDGSVAEVGGSISTGAHGYAPGPYAYPSAVYPNTPYGYSAGDYQQAGTALGASADVGRLLGRGADATAIRGQEYDALIDQDTPIAPAPVAAAPAPVQASAQVFTLQGGTQVVGTLMRFDKNGYVVATRAGQRVLRAAEVKSIDAAAPTSSPQ